MALDPFGLQHTVDPETVQTGLLDDDDRGLPPRPSARFLLADRVKTHSSAVAKKLLIGYYEDLAMKIHKRDL